MSMALKFLSRKQMTVSQLEKRLEEKEFSHEEIKETIVRLEEWKYLDDSSYAVSYIKSRREKYSKRRTMVELVKAGIDKELAIVLLEKSYTEDNEYQNCLRLGRKIWEDECGKWERKLKDSLKYQNIPRDVILKKKVGDKLLMRGFPLSTVKNILADELQRED